MYDLLESHDKYQRCRKMITCSLICFIISVSVFISQSFIPQQHLQEKPTSSSAWQKLLKMLTSGDFVPVKMDLHTIEFKNNSVYLIGFSTEPLTKFIDSWRVKKLSGGKLVLSKSLQ